MRPVLLEMTGFASFREATRVSFDDADYFALMGPTGAGKSTVIDAVTFALYGSVARWDREGMVAPALSPTTNHGVVRLLFDVAGARYSVVREIRRGGGRNPSVGVRNVRLERLHDPAALGGPDDGTDVIASDKEVTPAVQKLLGLDFRQFCTCVALPQGAFAEFLHAKAGDRQRILINLLGLDVYERISARAGEVARVQAGRAAALGDQLSEFADATDDKVAECAQRAGELAELRERIAKAAPALREAVRQRADAESVAKTLIEERDLLAGVAVPQGVAELDEAFKAAADARDAAAGRASAAEVADQAARAALRAAPARSSLEQVISWRRELGEVTAGLPALAQRVEATTKAESDARDTEVLANAALDRARADHSAKVSVADELKNRIRRLSEEHDQLDGLHEPTGLAKLAVEETRAAQQLADTSTSRDAAEKLEVALRAELGNAQDLSSLVTAVNTALALRALVDELSAEADELKNLEVKLRDAKEKLEAARSTLTAAGLAVEEADRADRASTLRVHLVVGAPCPVCEQDVRVLPDLTTDEYLAAARRAHTEAEQRYKAAERAAQKLERNRERAADKQASTKEHLQRSRVVLDDATLHHDLSEQLTSSWADPERLASMAPVLVASLSQSRDDRIELDARTKTAASDVVRTRKDVQAAQRVVDEARTAVEAARAELRKTRDRIAGLGAPLVDDVDLRAGWHGLTEWANERRAQLSAELARATASAGDMATEIELADQTRTAAQEGANLAREASRTAIRELQAATTTQKTQKEQEGLLIAKLADAPDEDVVEEQLAQVDRLKAQADEAEHVLAETRKHAQVVAETERQAKHKRTRARRELDQARDPLVRLGAPVLDGDILLTEWTRLVEWVGTEATRRDGEVAIATRTAAELAKSVGVAERELLTDLSANGVSIEPEVGRDMADIVLVGVTAAATEAASAHKDMKKRVLAFKRTAADIDAAQEKAQVAKQVADLLRSNNFPRWLVSSALDGLVAEASTALLELSGGQFELTHSNGDFLVVDHNEADATRSVKTLSGGETFQASLALALALSAQVGALAEAGAARLDAIFLDEGFGTLDDSTLDTVAATLENLASSGRRMVGIITHVAALAERVPVRFKVSRDSAGSHVTREAL